MQNKLNSIESVPGNPTVLKDIKYILAYLVPLSAAYALYFQGVFAWSTIVLVFLILPILELWTPESTENIPESVEESRSKRRLFDILLYLNAPMLYSLVVWYLYTLSHSSLAVSEIIGLTLSVGIVVGANGINVAHELGHRQHRWEQFLSKWMLLPALYQHFFIEHNRGHHKNVATDLDPASARLGESVYAFWVRSITGSWMSAWVLEKDRCQKDGQRVWSWQNEMLRFQVIQILWLGIIGFGFGIGACLGAMAVALVGVLLLETVNYLEHYGLRRQQLGNGRYEPVSPAHSWNSNHELGRIFLYELTRHSDHHFKANRKYQVLRHLDVSPQLPFGYPTSLLMCLVPPLWFYIMHPIVRTHSSTHAS
jgi:alkane 1-monooxygenase